MFPGFKTQKAVRARHAEMNMPIIPFVKAGLFELKIPGADKSRALSS
jgi:hypothetical protein